MISRLVNAIESVSWKKIVTVVLAGILVVTTTACNRSPVANATGAEEYKSMKQPNKELYDPIQTKKSGGMYPYEDVDAEPSDRTQRKVRELIDNAERNVNKVDNPDEFADNFKKGTPINKRVENLTEDVAESAKQLTEDVASGTQKNVKKLKANTQNAVENPETVLKNSRDLESSR
ncbi:MAG: hypothetical protein SWJ54_07135 [Cyanobacteriota bacterium]|nr:hypothetical protein [Cyanobacteriota bacterium]